MLRLALLLFTFFFFNFSFGQTNIVGIWKTTRVSYYDIFSKTKKLIYDFEKTDSIKKELYNQYLNHDTTDNEYVKYDTVKFKTELETNFKKFQLTRLEFRKNNSFYMISNGLIIPTVEPGWHFGDKLIGKWSKTKTLKLMIGTRKINRIFVYKIKELNNNKLVLAQTFGNDEEIFNEIIFVKE